MRTVEKHTLHFLKKFLLCVCLLKLIAFSSVTHAATNLNYNNASTDQYATGYRPYRPDIGRFSSLDPAGSPNGPNRYNYCNSDPVNNVDPDGLDWYKNKKTGKFSWFPQSTPIPGYDWYAKSLGSVNQFSIKGFDEENDEPRYKMERQAWLRSIAYSDGSVNFSTLTREEVIFPTFGGHGT